MMNQASDPNGRMFSIFLPGEACTMDFVPVLAEFCGRVINIKVTGKRFLGVLICQVKISVEGVSGHF